MASDLRTIDPNDIDEEEGVIVICLEASKHQYFPDNLHGHCCQCAVEVVWRPDAPEPSIKMCMNCAHAMMSAAEEAGETIEHVTTDAQREEMETLWGDGAVEKGIGMAEALRKLRG